MRLCALGFAGQILSYRGLDFPSSPLLGVVLLHISPFTL